LAKLRRSKNRAISGATLYIVYEEKYTNLNSWEGSLTGSAVFAFQTVAVWSALTGVQEGVSAALRLFDEVHGDRHWHLIA